MIKKIYQPSLDTLIAATAPWASDWNEILFYLRGPGMKNPAFSINDIIWLIDEIKNLRDEGFPYTTNVEIIRERLH